MVCYQGERDNGVADEEVVTEDEGPVPHTLKEAAAFYVEGDYTKNSYTNMRKDAIEHRVFIYKEYRAVIKELDKCLPDEYFAEEKEAWVPLQGLLDKSVKEVCEEVAVEWSEEQLQGMIFTVAVGSDSSPNHTNPHQTYKNPENENRDPLIPFFVTSMLLIKLESGDGGKWQFHYKNII